jgi:hypothetical protein
VDNVGEPSACTVMWTWKSSVLLAGPLPAPDAKDGEWSGGRATLMGGNMAQRGSRSDLAKGAEG